MLLLARLLLARLLLLVRLLLTKKRTASLLMGRCFFFIDLLKDCVWRQQKKASHTMQSMVNGIKFFFVGKQKLKQ